MNLILALCEPVSTHTDYILFLAGRNIDLENIKTTSEPTAPLLTKQKKTEVESKKKRWVCYRSAKENGFCNKEVSTERKKELFNGILKY